MLRSTITCPGCNTVVPIDTTRCPDCYEELAPLIRIQLAHEVAYNEGLRLAHAGQTVTAILKMHEAIALAPDAKAAYLVLGKLYARTGAWPQARWWLQQALERWPQDDGAHRALAALPADGEAGGAKTGSRRLRVALRIALVVYFVGMFAIGLSALGASLIAVTASPPPRLTVVPATAVPPGSRLFDLAGCRLFPCSPSPTPTVTTGQN